MSISNTSTVKPAIVEFDFFNSTEDELNKAFDNIIETNNTYSSGNILNDSSNINNEPANMDSNDSFRVNSKLTDNSQDYSNIE